MELTLQLKIFFLHSNFLSDYGSNFPFFRILLRSKTGKPYRHSEMLFSLSTVNQLEHHFVYRPLGSVQQSDFLTYCSTEMFRLFLGAVSTC